MRRECLPLALIVLAAFEGKALAEEPLLLETAPEASPATPVARSEQKRDLPSRVPPILLIVGGGLTTSFAGGFLLLAAAGPSMCEGTNCASFDATGFAVAGAVGVTAVIGGVIWLVDVNHRRRVIQHGAGTATSRPMLVPVYEPVTRTAALTFSQQF